MRILLGIAIVLGATAIGALLPLTFRDRFGSSLGTSVVCDVLSTGVKLGYLDVEKRKALMDAVAAASDVDVQAKALVEGPRTGCK
jgi:hypothetical protein